MPRITHILYAAALCAAPALAQPAGAPHDHREPPAPPPEAFTLCKDKTEGASVTITTPDGKTMAGTCRTIRTDNGSALAAMPNGRPGHRPPPEDD